MITSVYLAARFSRLPELNGYRAILEAEGVEVTSRWLLGGHEWTGTPDDEIPVDQLAGFATDDLEDIDRAEVVIAFTEEPRSGPARGGRHFEAGYAFAKGIPLIVVGHVENVFYALPGVIRCKTWEECHQLLLNSALVHVRPGTCVACGCTDDRACVDENGQPCSWVTPELCSACYAKTGLGMLPFYPPIDELSPEMQELLEADAT